MVKILCLQKANIVKLNKKSKYKFSKFDFIILATL